MSLSFVHKAEVAMRHELGIETIFFGRDFPHAEGTWPNTARLAERRVRGRSRRRAAAHARRERDPRAGAGPGRSSPRWPSGSVRRSTTSPGRTPELDPRLVANWDARGGYLKPPEQHDPDGHRRVAPGRPGARRVEELTGWLVSPSRPRAVGRSTTRSSAPGRCRTRTRSRPSSTSSSARRSSSGRGSNVGRVEQLPRNGQLLHQGARGREHVGRRRARHGRRGPRVPQHLPPPRQQAGVDRLPAARRRAGRCRQFVCKYHGWKYDLDGALHVRAAGERVLRPRQGRLRPRARALRRVGGVHLREPRPTSRASRCASSSARWSPRSTATRSTR